ncbi:hypothetical protein M422DRAFT_174233, partial [Sphaerobolus stellatus SS14]
YQDIKEMRRFDILNLENYDIILGMPFLFQHKVTLTLNPTPVLINSIHPMEMKGPDIIHIFSLAVTFVEEDLQEIRYALMKEAADLCRSAEDTPLPPLQAINHRIPLKDPGKVYSWHPSRCPEALRHIWQKKCDSYIQTGRWKYVMGQNSCPMLLVNKKPGPGGELGLQQCITY